MNNPVATEPILMLKTYDRGDGKLRIDAVHYRKHGENYVIFAANEPAACKPDWYLNLKADPVVEIQVDGMDHFAVASTPIGRDRLDIWPLVEALATNVERRLPRNVSGILLTPMD